jgi:transcriptional regulator with PAS, ATPase and Fis domain
MATDTDGTQELDRGDRHANVVAGFRVSVVEGAPPKSFDASSARCAIGSQEGNDIQLEDRSVSRFHCEIAIDGILPRIRDLASKNGTIVDGVRVVEAFLRSGSLIRVGGVTLRFDLLENVSRVPVSQSAEFHGLVGQSVAMRMALALVERAATSNMTVLLEGETGTGKGKAAEAIHRGSPRAKKPFLVVDCGAIPANLLESELFGHERNAFTGAGERRIGAFEEASGGTIFLDEIGEMPIELQPKLLRVLESKEIRRLGSNQHQKVDVRIVAATNRDLRTEVNAARFRADLYFRLAVLRITLPPLRQRQEDLPALAAELLDRIGAGEEAKAALLTPEMTGGLRRAAWPGNVRELRNYLERSLVFQEPQPLGEAAPKAEARGPEVDPSMPYAEARQRALDAFERTYVRALIDRHGGKVSAAAAAAGTGRVYLYKLARKHGIRPT